MKRLLIVAVLVFSCVGAFAQAPVEYLGKHSMFFRDPAGNVKPVMDSPGYQLPVSLAASVSATFDDSNTVEAVNRVASNTEQQETLLGEIASHAMQLYNLSFSASLDDSGIIGAVNLVASQTEQQETLLTEIASHVSYLYQLSNLGGGGDATAANQTTIIGHIDGLEALATEIASHTSYLYQLSGGTVGGATEAKQDSIIGHIDGLEALSAEIASHVSYLYQLSGGTPGGATEAKQDTIIGHVDGIEGSVDGVEALLSEVASHTSYLYNLTFSFDDSGIVSANNLVASNTENQETLLTEIASHVSFLYSLNISGGGSAAPVGITSAQFYPVNIFSAVPIKLSSVASWTPPVIIELTPRVEAYLGDVATNAASLISSGRAILERRSVSYVVNSSAFDLGIAGVSNGKMTVSILPLE